jgi:hypothetical protein
VPPLQPDGSQITTNVDSSIMNAAEMNNTIVCAHMVSNAAGDRDLARWYAIDVSDTGNPTLQDQGDVIDAVSGAGQANVYNTYPVVDINAAGDIGITYTQSGTDTSTDFMSAYVAGRQASDPVGTMEAPVLVQAGGGLNNDGREGDLSGINVDSNGTFWASTEWTDASSQWNEEISNFSVGVGVPGNLVTIASEITHSQEYYSLIVTDAYQKYLGRTPDANGLAYWVYNMELGLSDEQLEAGFISSREFIADHGDTAQGWVTGLYQVLLNRQPDQPGLQYWVTQLSTYHASPYAVAYGFAASAEREAQRITNDYLTYLGRQPDQAGLDYWVDQFVNHGVSNENVIAGFVGSSEYYNATGGSDPATWIQSVYQQVLGRQPSNSEVSYWMNQLN